MAVTQHRERSQWTGVSRLHEGGGQDLTERVHVQVEWTRLVEDHSGGPGKPATQHPWPSVENQLCPKSSP